MSPSSFAPNLADSDGASEDTFPSLRPPPTDLRPPASAQRASADGRSKIADRLQLELLNNPFTDSRPPTTAYRPPTPDSRPSAQHAAAFSLVELLVVVGIVAMLSVAAVPVMRGLGGAQSSRATAQILVSALEQARTAAILSGTNVYLALPDGDTTTMSPTNYLRTYALIRPLVDQDGNGNDDFQTNISTNSGWVLLSKWERLPGDLQFSPAKLRELASTNPNGLAFPGNTGSSPLRLIGFAPSGGLADTTGTNGLLFASSNKVAAGKAAVADRIEISLYSGRVRYAGLTNNVDF